MSKVELWVEKGLAVAAAAFFGGFVGLAWVEDGWRGCWALFYVSKLEAVSNPPDAAADILSFELC